MIDWHSHVLPEMDDGSRNVEESLSMLRTLRQQGVECVIATPHFYADDESLESFLDRRERSAALLEANLTEDMPELLYGAEVRYYPGISRMKGLERLKIGQTNLLLLEMPFAKWTEYTVRELEELAFSGNFTVILAHIERYLSLQPTEVWERLLESGMLMQVNASFFLNLGSKHKALKLLDTGRIHIIGSDSHNMTSRPPRIGQAYEVIRKKFGDGLILQINELENYLLVK